MNLELQIRLYYDGGIQLNCRFQILVIHTMNLLVHCFQEHIRVSGSRLKLWLFTLSMEDYRLIPEQ